MKLNIQILLPKKSEKFSTKKTKCHRKKPDPETKFEKAKRRIYGISKVQFMIAALVSVTVIFFQTF